MSKKRKILFISESVTLAHISRPYLLAMGLDREKYEITLAWNRNYASLFPPFPFKNRIIETISTPDFLKRINKGITLYNRKTLEKYIQDDLRLLEEEKPDIVIGDFRQSLAISARLTKIPWINLANAYWLPEANAKFLVPDHILVKLFGEKFSQFVFDYISPIALSLHGLTMYSLMKKNGIPPPKLNLGNIYTQGDYTLFYDSPYLIPCKNLANNQEYLGPILWSPEIAKPSWWDEILNKKPIVYITLGSSGNIALLPNIIQALKNLPITILLATASKEIIPNLPSNVYQNSYLPGIEASALSDLVISNGGSPTTQQALSQGVPVLGIASNMDQFLNMYFVERAGTGLYLRAGLLDPKVLHNTVENMLKDQQMKLKALEMKDLFAKTDPVERFNNFLEKHFP